MKGAKKIKKDETAPNLSFEEAMSRLEAIVKELEGGEIPLEKSLGLFEEGVALSKLCHGKLAEAEKKVQLLLKSEDGELTTQPFEVDDEDEDEDQDGEDNSGTSLF